MANSAGKALLMLVLIAGMCFAGGCATNGPPDITTPSPAANIKMETAQVLQLGQDIAANMSAIEALIPPMLMPKVQPHSHAIHVDANLLTGEVARGLTAASKDAGRVAAERDQWHKAYTDEVARQKSALQSELRKVSIGAGLVGLVLIGLGIWLGISGNIKWAASVGAGGVAALVVAGIVWKIAPYIGWIIWLTVFALILVSVLFVLHKVGLDKITQAWSTLVGAIENAGEDAAAVKNEVVNSLSKGSQSAKVIFKQAVGQAKAKL